ncbi:hypothetical protein YPS_3912 [Yersinia pestis Pestoides A]|nr:hypothetical protein YPS_3912 [Yersinia pestis Pestoides A]
MMAKFSLLNCNVLFASVLAKQTKQRCNLQAQI